MNGSAPVWFHDGSLTPLARRNFFPWAVSLGHFVNHYGRISGRLTRRGEVGLDLLCTVRISIFQ